MNKIVESAVSDYIKSLQIPDEIRRLISQAKWDLYHGPLYLDADGDECSPFDENARQFDFSGACDKIRDCLNDLVVTIYTDDWSGCWSITMPECELDDEGYVIDQGPFYCIPVEQIIIEIIGKELAQHV